MPTLNVFLPIETCICLLIKSTINFFIYSRLQLMKGTSSPYLASILSKMRISGTNRFTETRSKDFLDVHLRPRKSCRLSEAKRDWYFHSYLKNTMYQSDRQVISNFWVFLLKLSEIIQEIICSWYLINLWPLWIKFLWRKSIIDLTIQL